MAQQEGAYDWTLKIKLMKKINEEEEEEEEEEAVEIYKSLCSWQTIRGCSHILQGIKLITKHKYHMPFHITSNYI